MNALLAWADVERAAMVGTRRQVQALERGLPDRHGYKGDGWDVHIHGACAELAVANALGATWEGHTLQFSGGKADVAGLVEVRWRSRSSYELLVRPQDAPGRAWVLVTGRLPELDIRGWIWGRDAKRKEWWRRHGGRPGAFFVPHAALRPIEELAGELGGMAA